MGYVLTPPIEPPAPDSACVSRDPTARETSADERTLKRYSRHTVGPPKYWLTRRGNQGLLGMVSSFPIGLTA
jgi:hypothetical protein